MAMIRAMVAGLLASVGLVPAAAAQDGSLRDAMRARMQARMEARGQPAAPARNAPLARGGEWRRPDRPERVDTSGWRRGDGVQPGDRARAGTAPPAPPAPPPPPALTPPQGDPRRDRARWGDPAGRGELDPAARSRTEWRSGRDDRSPGWDRRDGRGRPDEGWRSERRVRGSVVEWGSARGAGRDRDGRWDHDWRRDRRFDWSGYRSANRSAYRLPRYYAPYGWGDGYRRFGIGVRIAPPLFAQGYWIADPWSYRLPDAYGPYRWVRYYDDALLVDLDSGQVVDVIYDIFW
ncbi:RcnB family protein [Sphingomonas sp. DT-51]|uniref:RcnB family protein n=1 Tax=Sphingomonas sp. DT-51 TaxID=3396165 RepID=UPI003F53F4B6